jgi:hypothetical protein
LPPIQKSNETSKGSARINMENNYWFEGRKFYQTAFFNMYGIGIRKLNNLKEQMISSLKLIY